MMSPTRSVLVNGDIHLEQSVARRHRVIRPSFGVYSRGYAVPVGFGESKRQRHFHE